MRGHRLVRRRRAAHAAPRPARRLRIARAEALTDAPYLSCALHPCARTGSFLSSRFDDLLYNVYRSNGTRSGDAVCFAENRLGGGREKVRTAIIIVRSCADPPGGAPI